MTKAKKVLKPFIPIIICVVILISVICIWLIIYQCKPEPYSNTVTRIMADNPNVPTIELTDVGATKNFIQKMFDPLRKLHFRINKSGGNYNIEIPSYEDYNFGGKGLVVAASGNKYRYMTGLYTNLYVIRHVYRSNIPVEIFYVGSRETFSSKVKKLLEDLGNVKIINLMDAIDTNVTESELRGYQTKPLASLCSSFEEIILMDADALSFIDPYQLFDAEGYYSSGMVLFRDYVDCMKFISKDFIETIGIGADNYCQKTEGYEIDSSCIIMNKRKCWDALYTICIINVKSDSYYKTKQNVLGDKDTWLIGSIFAGIDPYISKPRPAVIVTDKGTQVLGHLQSTNFNRSVSTPIYYNNQMVDLNTAEVDNWTFKIEKNPNRSNGVKPGQPLTQNMLKSFAGAKQAMKLLVPEIPNKLKSNLNVKDGVTKGFIP